MSKLWFASDHHFGHANIIKYCNRPFSSTEDMDLYMIAQHNLHVHDDDKVYFLGDVAFNKDIFHKVMPQLRGKKRLIIGNHDKLPMNDYLKYFEKVLGAFNYKTDVASYTFTHYPAHISSFNPNGDFFNVHGHIHDKKINDRRYINISVEHTYYAPVDLDWLDASIQ